MPHGPLQRVVRQHCFRADYDALNLDVHRSLRCIRFAPDSSNASSAVRECAVRDRRSGRCEMPRVQRTIRSAQCGNTRVERMLRPRFAHEHSRHIDALDRSMTCHAIFMLSNDRVERPATMHDAAARRGPPCLTVRSNALLAVTILASRRRSLQFRSSSSLRSIRACRARDVRNAGGSLDKQPSPSRAVLPARLNSGPTIPRCVRASREAEDSGCSEHSIAPTRAKRFQSTMRPMHME